MLHPLIKLTCQTLYNNCNLSISQLGINAFWDCVKGHHAQVLYIYVIIECIGSDTGIVFENSDTLLNTMILKAVRMKTWKDLIY